MSEYKNQHFLPQFYLRNFVNDKNINYFNKKDPPIWRYKIKEKDLKFQSISNVAMESYLYSSIEPDGKYNHEVEKYLSKIECNAADVLSKFLNKINKLKGSRSLIDINRFEKEILSEFISWQIKRTPKIINQIKNVMNKAFSEELANYPEEEKMIIQTIDQKILRKNAQVSALKMIGESPEKNFKKLLLKKEWHIFFTSKYDASFITSDNPVIRLSGSRLNGIQYPETQIWFPLSSNVILGLWGTIAIFKLGNYPLTSRNRFDKVRL